ncbi:MAG: hypothetical protein J5636_00295 [Clostridiales bacterium]|nr:hypothetical protein [Clostridiales bacterium]
MKAYFESLKTETSWFKLFRPICIGMTILIETVTPLVIYIFQVLIKHQEPDLPSFWYGLVVAFLYSAALAWVISNTHKKAQQTKILK